MALLALFSGLLVGMNLLGGKIVSVFGISASVAVFMVPLAFLLTDIASEIYGRRVARQFTFAGLFALLVIMGYTSLFTALAPHERFAADEAYRTIFGASLRIMAASVAAFLLSQLNDVWIFERVRRATGGRLLWLRTNASTFVSQTIDTTFFMFIAFYRTTPLYDAAFILKLIIPYLLLKLVFASLITPLVYAGVRVFRGVPRVS